ncbi:glycosyltransferase family 90 protein [Pochonia chlamydosporia 170]|uniref:Glycosyltransferase family 90 protein n=1 Tax=Pochonia chlamydosporia 170 TaxID=1380566 RepID=A0A179F0S3_METCM|nr:glycosyltransferase family 90 protein [Pochonia chlamydosporia 170]OAQ59054.1 glycosyltransferase family 90 protein [Pochonia chlamydosporia 170]
MALMSSFNPVLVVRCLRAATAFAVVSAIIFASVHISFRWQIGNSRLKVCPSHISEDDFSTAAIRCRILSAQAAARSVRKPQSSTPAEAVAEYKRRYHRPPPKGFEEWVTFALERDSKIIDDFDQIDRDLEPYRDAEARQTFQSLKEKSWDCPLTTRIECRNGTMSTSAQYRYDGELRRLVEPFVDAMPDGLFYLSLIDEPRILSRSGPRPSSVQFQEKIGESIEDLIADSCGQITPQPVESFLYYKDVCRSSNPASLHALVSSPGAFSYTHSLIPVLSFGRMSAFRDILIPCPCYVAHPLAENDPLSFLEKKPVLYWRGSSTGGRATRFGWKNGHRQRFVRFVRSLQEAANALEASQLLGLGVDSLSKKRIQLFKDAFDVHMSDYLQCDDDACKDMERTLGPTNFEPEDTTENYRYLFDLDGNSMSTRFYRLLSREAVVLKQTWFQEWHDDRLTPWAHYIPVSMTMEELPALLEFLINDPNGELLSAEIAKAGSMRSREVLREADMSIYLYRLLLEMTDLLG